MKTIYVTSMCTGKGYTVYINHITHIEDSPRDRVQTSIWLSCGTHIVCNEPKEAILAMIQGAE